MAALLVGLRWRQLGRQLSRNPWMIVGLVVGGLGAINIIGLAGAGIAGLLFTAPQLLPGGLVIAGSVLVVGWGVGAVLVSSDELLAPERFALLPVSAGRLLPGLVLAGASGIGGIGTAVGLLVMLVGWSVSPAALIAALLLAPVALATCVLTFRVVGGLLARQLANRRMRDLVAVVGVLLLICSGMLFQLMIGALGTLGSFPATIDQLGAALAWTPVGAAFGVPHALATGDVLAAIVRLAVALGTLTGLWFAARALVARRLTEPITAGGGRVRTGKVLDRLLPATPTGAIAARVLRYRRRDPRHLINVLSLVVLPLFLIGLQIVAPGRFGADSGPPAAMIFVPCIIALLVVTVAQMEIAYDNDAVALHIHAGVSGRADRAGRLLGIGIVTLPIVVLACVASALLAGRPELIPASLGAALGLCAVAAGVGAWVGAYMPGRAPAPEANPLGRGSSGGVQSLLAMLIVAPITLGACAPAIGFAIAAIWNPGWGWLSLVLGIVPGVVALWLSIRFGGDAVGRRWPELLRAVTSES